MTRILYVRNALCLVALCYFSSAGARTAPLSPFLIRTLRRTGSGRSSEGRPNRSGRSLLATTTQPKCIWTNYTGSSVGSGSCFANDNLILTLPGRPPTESAKLLAYTQHRMVLCSRHESDAACGAAADLGCGWDSSTGECFMSAAALLNPEVLRGRLFCPGSLLDVAATCALQLPGSISDPSGAGSSSSSIRVSGCSSNPACTSLSGEQLRGLAAAAGAARPYLRLAALASYTNMPDGMDGKDSGACVARWLTQPDTLAALRRSVEARPAAGLLQPDLVGSGCGSSGAAAAEMQRLGSAAAAAAARCAAAASSDACGGVLGCEWDEGGGSTSGGGGGGSSGSCVVGGDAVLDLLFDPADPWVKALDVASAACEDRSSSAAACGEGGSISVDPARMETWRNVLVDGGTEWVDSGSAGRGGGRAPGLLRSLLLAALAAVLTTAWL